MAAEASTTIVIERPLEDVWAILTDPEKSAIWSTPTVEEHWLTPPPVGVGSRRRAVNRAFGRQTQNDAEVTEYEPNRLWTMATISGPRFTARATFEAVAEGTRVDWTWSMRLGRGLGLLEPSVARWFVGRFAKDLERLKVLMETGQL